MPKPLRKPFQEMHHLVQWRGFEILTDLNNNKRGLSWIKRLTQHILRTNSLETRMYKARSSIYLSNLVSPKISNVTWQSSVSLCFCQMCLWLHVWH